MTEGDAERENPTDPCAAAHTQPKLEAFKQPPNMPKNPLDLLERAEMKLSMESNLAAVTVAYMLINRALKHLADLHILAVGATMLSHIALDLLIYSGMPLLAPLNRRRFSLGLTHSGSPLFILLMLAGVAVILSYLVNPLLYLLMKEGLPAKPIEGAMKGSCDEKRRGPAAVHSS